MRRVLTTIAITAFWLSMNTLLIYREVWPTLTARNDGGYRELGAVIESTCKQLDIAAKLKELATLASLSAPQVWIAKTAVDLLFHTVVAALKNNHDDVIQDFHFSALAHQDYRAGKHPFEYRGARGIFEVIVK